MRNEEIERKKDFGVGDVMNEKKKSLLKGPFGGTLTFLEKEEENLGREK